MIKKYFRYASVIPYAAALLLALLVMDNVLDRSLAQHRAENRTAPAKSKPKAKTAVPARTQNVQQKINADGSITGALWVGEAGITETTADIMARTDSRYAELRLENYVERPRRNNPPQRENLPQHPGALPGGQWPSSEDGGTGGRGDKGIKIQSPSLPLSFSPGLSFTAGTLASVGSFPPDTMGAVGPTQFLMAVNGRIRVFSKSTGAVGELDADMDSFFNSVRGSDATTDPRVQYDRLTGRWFVLIINVAAANNRVLLAVSDGATISSATVWTFYQFQQNLATSSGDNGCFADYPSLGIDANAIYVGVNQFCGRAFTNTTAFVIRKSSVLNNGQIVVTAFRNLIDTAGGALTGGIFSPVGVSNADPPGSSGLNTGDGFFIGTDAKSFGRLVLRRVTNPGGVPVMSPNLYLNVLTTSAPITVRHKGNFNGVNGRLDAVDDRLLSACLRDGSIWAAHNIAVNNLGTTDAPRTRNGVRWYEISAVNSQLPQLAQAGTLFAPTDTNTEDERNYFMPSLMVSGQRHLLLGFSTAGTNEYINAAIAGRWATDPLGTLQAPQLITASPAPYNPSSNSGNLQGRRRWGDYSFTSLDPCDDMTMWTIQQFGDALDSYGLRVARIPAPPPATPAIADPPAIAAGQVSVNVTVTGLPLNGAGFYDPGDGFNCRLRAAVSGGVTVNWISYINPTTLVLNLSTVSAGAGTKSITITNPDGQVATGNHILTVGACSYAVSPTQLSFSASGGTGTIRVETAPACGWTAAGNSGFISIQSGAAGAGNGTVSFSVAPTIGLGRTGTITVAGQSVAISQSAGSGCNYALSSSGKSFPASGGTGSFNVVTSPDCLWTAAASDAFVSILFTSTGQGTGTVSFAVAANDRLVARSATITAGGQVFTIAQDSPPFELSVDDGTFETFAGNSAGGISYRINRLTPGFYPATLDAVTIYFPDNASVKIGDSFTVLVGANPDGDGNIDGTIFQTIQAQVQALGDFNVITVPPVTISEGDFLIGVRLNQAANVFPFALDTTKSKARSYRSLDGQTFTLIDSEGVNGNYGIRARLARPAKLIVAAGATLEAESCQPANRTIDPGETVTVSLSLGNNGAVATRNLTATIVASGNVVLAGQAGLTGAPESVKSYGAISPGGAFVTRQFTFTASGACGGTFPVKLNLKDGDEDFGTVNFNFTLGTLGTAGQTFSYNGGAVKIPDGDARGVSIPLTVSGFPGNLADLNFRIDGTECIADRGATAVGVDHSWVGDLVFRLTSPAGTTVTIINRAGGSGNSGRNFCRTVLDDDAANALSINTVAASGAPFTGTFKPSNPLSAFDGENPNGIWTLTVIDSFSGDNGNVRAFSLSLTGFACCSTGCLDVAGLSATGGAAGSQVTINGAGFNGVTSVKFGDVPASFTIGSNTSLIATVPAEARTAPIVLSRPGCVDAQTQTFTAFPAIALTPASLSATTGGPAIMTVSLSYPRSNGTPVTLASMNTSLATVPASVIIPAGAVAADFQVTGLAPGGPVTITATLPANLGGGSTGVTASVRAGLGYEADVTPRPTGNNTGSFTVTDWVQIGRFLAGLEAPANGGEFQRADVAPRETLGDGSISLIDWVQAGRYVAGLDPPALAGGPTAPIVAKAGREMPNTRLKANAIGASNRSGSPELSAMPAGNLLKITLQASGAENALGFSVSFDPKQWRFVAAQAGRDAQPAAVVVNTTEIATGRIGILLALPGGKTLRAGVCETVILRFEPRSRMRQLPLAASFAETPIAAAAADSEARSIVIRQMTRPKMSR